MKVAIIGAGFCGLAVAWNLINEFPDASIKLFDQSGIGSGASGIAAGLLHPFSGAHAKLNRRGFEGYSETLKLLDVASESLGESVIFENKGILRLAVTADQEQDFKHCATKYPLDTEWLDSQSCQILIPYCASLQGLWINKGVTVHCSKYLRGLWKACEKRGVQLIIQNINNIKIFNTFDLVIFTIGSGFKDFPQFKSLPLSYVKGQVLELKWPSNIPPLKYPINSHVYIAMKEGNQSCFVGATYERNFNKEFIDVELAKNELLSKAFELYPSLENTNVLNCYAGLRVSTPTHLPLITEIEPNKWVLTGMGSKGLLYHALYAKELIGKFYK